MIKVVLLIQDFYSSLESVDCGINWTKSNTNYSKVVVGNGIYVGISRSCEIHTSSDQQNWVPTYINEPDRALDVVYRNGMFAVVTEHNIITSSDGRSWTYSRP
jgi:hypothetical protein